METSQVSTFSICTRTHWSPIRIVQQNKRLRFGQAIHSLPVTSFQTLANGPTVRHQHRHQRDVLAVYRQPKTVHHCLFIASTQACRKVKLRRAESWWIAIAELHAKTRLLWLAITTQLYQGLKVKWLGLMSKLFSGKKFKAQPSQKKGPTFKVQHYKKGKVWFYVKNVLFSWEARGPCTSKMEESLIFKNRSYEFPIQAIFYFNYVHPDWDIFRWETEDGGSMCQGRYCLVAKAKSLRFRIQPLNTKNRSKARL